MTEPKELLRPLEPAQRLAAADRETLEALQAALGECTSLIAAQGAAARQAADRHQEMLQACADRLGRLAESMDAEGAKEEARHADLAAGLRQVQAAIAGFPERLDGTFPEHLTDVRANLTAQNDALREMAGVLQTHSRQQLAMVKALEALGSAFAALSDKTHGSEVLQAHLGQTRALGDLARNTTSLAARVGKFEALLARRKGSLWLLVTIPLLLAFVYGAGLMTDVMIRILDGSAGLTMPLVTEFMFWLSPGSGPEAAAPE